MSTLCSCPVLAVLSACLIVATTCAAEPATRPSVLQRADELPIAVWVQEPGNASRYKAIGINLYVGLWKGPTAKQLETLESAGLGVICSQNEEALKTRWANVVAAFMHGDEPDNAQELGKGQKGYGPPILPERIVEHYRTMKAKDPRPVLLNLGQGVAYDNYIGRGVRRNKPEDYPEYAKGADIVSFDIYPAVHDSPEVAGKLWYVGRGVERLVRWTEGRKPVWACIECTHIGNANVKPTPRQVRSEVWMALIHGARGIIYFAHQFQPKFIEAGLLADAEMAEAVRGINAEVQGLAPVILGARPAQQADVTEGVAVMTREREGITYVFAVGMTEKRVQARVRLIGVVGEVAVVNEGRAVTIDDDGAWADQFDGYEVHVYSARRR